ncbi:MAG: glutathione ABC transporter permease GsiC, partial [Chloroflexota bacterium]
MQKYIIQRLLLAIPTLLLMSLFVFAVLRILPGDVVRLILGGGEGQSITQVSLDTIKEELGLDKPLY